MTQSIPNIRIKHYKIDPDEMEEFETLREFHSTDRCIGGHHVHPHFQCHREDCRSAQPTGHQIGYCVLERVCGSKVRPDELPDDGKWRRLRD